MIELLDKRDKEELQSDINKRIEKPDIATVGQVIAVEEVDEDGKPTKFKAVNMSGGSGGGSSEETDPTVYNWAKQPTKPKYTASEVGALPASTFIPSMVSQLTNDSKYQTEDQVRSIINSSISGGTHFTFERVSELPETGIENIIYLLGEQNAGSYTEYIWINDESRFELIGSTDIDLSNVYEKSETYSQAEVDALIQSINGAISTLRNETSNSISQLSGQKLDKPATAEVGQMIVVKAVGEDGKPTEVEAVNVPKTEGGGITAETDPTVPSWAKQPNKPTYTASEVGADASGTAQAKVTEHNTDEDSHNDIRLLITGLTNKLNALADSDDTTLDQMSEIVAYIKSNKSLIDSITTGKVSVSDIIDNLTTSVSNKPLSAKQGVQLKALIDAIVVPTLLSQLGEDANHRTVTDAEKSVWNGKSNFSGSYGDLTDKPTIPTKLSQLTNDMNFATPSQLPTITQEAGESESLVMSQKAVTKLVSDALDQIETTEFETVDSVDKMTDTTKQYVLSTTGTVWTYGETVVEVEPTNKFVPSTAKVNTRLGSSSESASNGLYATDYIEFDGSTAKSTIVWLPTDIDLTVANQRLWLCDSGKAILSTPYVKSEYGSSVVIGQDSDTGRYYMDISKLQNGTAVDLSKVKYIRICLATSKGAVSISASDIANMEILFENDRTTTITNDWYDTGLTPESASSGGNYVDLLVKVNENRAKIAETNLRLTEIESGSETLTIPTVWKTAVEECIAKIKALQVGRNCITFPFFSDNHQRNGYSGLLIAHIMKECHIPYCFYGGDSISSGNIPDEATMIEQDKAFDTIMSYVPNGRLCRAVGNHDGYWTDGTNKYYYTDAQIYELFLREESVAQNKHFGGDGTYYYVDDVSSKVRFIVLDTNDSTVEEEQLAWLQNTALAFNESGWAIVFISHQPISNHYHALINNAEAVRTIVRNYMNGSSSNKADVVGWFSGHIHRDRIYTGIATNSSDDTQGDAMGFTQVTITSDHTGIAYDDATKHTVSEDNQSHAIDFVTINKSTRTVNLTRLGIGSDRSYTY